MNTLVINPDGVLNENNHLRGTVIIHVDDLAKAFKSSSKMKSSEDDIMNIPYQLYFEKMD